MEILATINWNRLVPTLVKFLGGKDNRATLRVLKGALITLRKNRVPTEWRSPVADILRTRLNTSDGSGLKDYSHQTELICEIIDTFRSFALATDLPLVKRFWQSDCIFPLQLRAIQAATDIVSRYPDSPETNAFFECEQDALEKRLKILSSERMVAIDNGTLLWAVADLLLARLAGESKAVATIAKENSQLRRKLSQMLKNAKDLLQRSGHTAWLLRNRDNVSHLENELSA
jgi:hypothetical protein